MSESERIAALRKVLAPQAIHPHVREQIDKLLVFRELLGPIERQERYLVEVYAAPRSCSSCGVPTGFYETLVDPENYRLGFSSGHKHKCTHCGAALRDIVPFMAAGVTWFWHVDAREEATTP